MDAPILPPDQPPGPHPFRRGDADEPARPDPFDALADLFLGPAPRAEATSPAPLRLVGHAPIEVPAVRPDPQPRPVPREPDPELEPGARTPIEGLVLGHLPVFASAWATQYAKHVAQSTNATVAMLRFAGGRVMLDLYSGGPVPHPEPSSDLREAIARALALAPRWIVRLPEAAEPELAEGDIEAVTLLTGADEAAVVASYRTLKSLAGPYADGARPNPPAWRLAVMGADTAKADEAGQKVRRAVEAFLGSELELSPCIARIGSLRSTLLFEGAAPLSWRDVVRLIRTTPPAPSNAPPTPPTPPPSSGPGNARPALVPASAPTAAVIREPKPEPRPLGGPRPQARSAEPMPTPVPTPITPAPGWLPGLRPSQARCPFAPGIELASDPEGRLHLVARGDDAGSLKDLVAAAAWASEHAPLLAMADPSITDATDPALHVLTTTPAQHRRLLDTRIRVHAVARVGEAWTVLDLN